MLEAAEIKQEDMTDTRSLLRKFEMKFYDLCEFRERETEGGTGGRYVEIKDIEEQLAKDRKTAKQLKKMTDEKAKQDMNRLKMEEKAKKRDQIVRVSGKRDAARSNKPQLNNKKEEKPIIDQDEVDL